jgi:hypothetical protein
VVRNADRGVISTSMLWGGCGLDLQDFNQTTDQEVVVILDHHPHPHTQRMPAHTAVATPAGKAAAVPDPGLPKPGAGHHAAAGAASATAQTGSQGPDLAKAPVPAATGNGCLVVDTAAISDQAAQHAQHMPATPTQVSSLAAALNHLPAASPTAAAGFTPVANEEIVITDSELGVQLHGSLTVPHGALGLVVFAHGSGSSRNSPRNRQVASTLHRAGESHICGSTGYAWCWLCNRRCP